MLLLTACSATNPSAQENTENSEGKTVADTLTVAFKLDPPTLDYSEVPGLAMATLDNLLFDQLLYVDTEGNIQPGIATSWEQVDDLTFHFTIRDDVYFHNGDKLTAEDVAYSIQRLTWTKGGRTTFSPVIDADNTKALSDTEVEMKLLQVYAPILSQLSSSWGNVVCKRAVEEMGDGYSRAPVGSGPMVFENWVSGDSITFVRNENYWGTPVSYKKLIARPISEAATRAAEVEAGGVDIALDILSSDVSRLESAEGAEVAMADGCHTVYFGFNTNMEPVNDLRVRQAFAYALNLEELVAAAYENDTATVATAPLPKTVKWSLDTSPYTYDVEKAKQLLEEAGYPDGISLECWIAKDNILYTIAQIAQNMWAKAGINVELVVNETTACQTAAMAGEIAMLCYNYTSSNLNEPGLGLKWFRQGEVSIWSGLRDDELEEALIGANATYDEAQREACVETAQHIILDQCYQIPVSNKKVIYGVRSNVENFVADPSSNPNLRPIVVNK